MNAPAPERIAVRRLPQQPGPAAWNAILPPRAAAARLETDASVDIAIIGGGFAGLSAARRLAQLDPALKTAVLEAARIGDGPAGRNSGFMIDLPHDLASEEYAGADMSADQEQIRRNRIAIRFAAEAAAEYAMPAQAYDPSGKINGAATAAGSAHNRSYAAHLDAMNEPSEMLDAQAMRDITGSDYYQSGLHTPGTVMLQPALYIRSLAEGLASNGVHLFENSPVVRLEKQASGWRLHTPQACLAAGKIILAVNGHAESFGFFRRRLMHVFTYASMTRALAPAEISTLGGAEKWGITPADPMGASVRRIGGLGGIGGDRIVVRLRFTYDPSMTVPPRRMTSLARLHDRSFRRRFPRIADTPMEYRWGGHLCLSRNGVSAFGEVADNLYAACCQNGLGTARGTLSGIAAAELALAAPSPLADALCAEDPPQRLPPEPLAWLGANAYMRWKEWRAGAEA